MFLVSYAMLAAASMGLRDALTLSTLFWPPVGLLLAALLLSRPRHWPGWMVLAAVLHVAAGILVAGRTWQVASIFAAADLVLCGGIAALYRLWATPAPALRGLRNCALFLALLGAAAMTGGVLVVTALKAMAPYTPAVHWYVWTVAGWVGCLVVTPLVVAGAQFRVRRLADLQLSSVWIGLLSTLALLAATVLVFDSQLATWTWNQRAYDLAYVPLFFLAIVAMAWGPLGTAMAVLGLASIACGYTLGGMGPFGSAGSMMDGALVAVQGYIGAAAMLSVLVAALGAERRAATRGARD
jgi:integral membrane sensor domain MASE1